TAISTSPAAVAAAPKLDGGGPAAVAAEEEEAVPLGTEWAGLTGTRAPRPEGKVISDEKTWKKAWRLLRSGRAPKVNFTDDIVVGVFAGKGEKGDHAEIQAVEMSLSGLVVRYHFIRYATFNVDATPRSSVPYLLRVVPRTTAPVQFDLVEDKEDVPSKPKSQEKK
ncbi:MAG: hypothetical protein KGL74_05360, partial [Elusimicrobia bacterium]|nr:hypothetical protein [Elusimicrobiota bacterium]